ncbi:MAG TPA: hypothetical protein VN580_05120 [Clostridia bacterium]|nr:hypothetical protein [Clostridia bacterium]
MDYSVKPLSPELADTFTDYLTNLDFSHSPHWSTCFCRFYHKDQQGTSSVMLLKLR